ncbi:MAG TPA: serine hydrolase [Longimicrobium sp.]|nr:serine hydrolase [Longimicrobium sp.]
MTRSIRRTCTLLALAALAGPLPARAQRPLAAGFPPELDAYLERALREWQIPGMAIAVVRNDSVLVAKGYGVKELGRPGRVDEHTVFDAASLTKSFTATAVAMLVDEGKMRWDDPVVQHLPDLVLPDPYLTRNATVRDFLSHRTGLHGSNMMWYPTSVDRPEVLRRMRFVRASAPFRTGMVYSNIGYTVAGEAAARAAGTSWEDLVRRRIIRPLGLTSTVASYADTERMPNVASPHALIGGVQRPIRREVQRSAIAPAGDVQSTVTDLATWMRFHLANGVLDGRRLVSDSSMQEMHSPQAIIATTPGMRAARQVEFFAAYGLGWQVMDYRGHPMLWHSGNGDGQIAYMALLPKDRLGVVVLVNTWAAPFVHGALASYILDVYLGLEPRDHSAEALARVPAMREAQEAARRRLVEGLVPGSSPPLPLAAYAGTYVDSLFGPVSVRVEGRGLVMQMDRGQQADLLHQEDDTFVVRWRDEILREFFGTRVEFGAASDCVRGLQMRLNRDSIAATRSCGPG